MEMRCPHAPLALQVMKGPMTSLTSNFNRGFARKNVVTPLEKITCLLLQQQFLRHSFSFGSLVKVSDIFVLNSSLKY